MKIFKVLSVAFCLSALAALAVSCSKDATLDEGKLTNKFLIDIDNVTAPEKIEANMAFDLLLNGYVGPDGCHHFSNFNIEKTNKVVNIEVWGEAPTTPENCTQAIVFLNNQKLNLKLEEKGTYQLRFKRKNGTYLEKSVTVE